MQIRESDQIIERFIRKIKTIWQIIFLVCVVFYGAAFIHHFSVKTPPRLLPYFRTIDLISFAIALALALAVFYYKRRIFSTRALKKIIADFRDRLPQADEKTLTNRITGNIQNKLYLVWLMGGAIVILGVIFYWWTFTTKNMHIYFIVGLYSLLMNYPRKDLFLDIPYLVHEVYKEGQENP